MKTVKTWKFNMEQKTVENGNIVKSSKKAFKLSKKVKKSDCNHVKIVPILKWLMKLLALLVWIYLTFPTAGLV